MASAAVEVVVDILHHRRPLIAAEAVLATVHVGDHGTLAEPPSVIGVNDRFWLVYDHQMRIIAADPRMARIGISPTAQVGMLAALTAHPEDVVTLVAHEPPIIGVLPDAEAAHRASKRFRDAYQAQGWGHGMAGFMALGMWQGEFTDAYFAQPAPDPAAFGMPADDVAIWFGILVLIVVGIGLTAPPIGSSADVGIRSSPDSPKSWPIVSA